MKLFNIGCFALSFAASSVLAQVSSLAGLSSDFNLMPNPSLPMYQQTGEQYRVYDFPGTGEPIPYRLYVPETWTAESQLPVLVTLRAGPSINNNHRANNDLVREAAKRHYIVISPLGYRGYAQPYYGSSYPIMRPDGPSVPAAGWTEIEDQRAKLDVLYVLSLVANEYNADLSRIFIHGQNPSGSAAFNFVAEYPELFAGMLASAAPIVTEDFPFEKLAGKVAVMMIHGELDTRNTIGASEDVTAELKENGIEAIYKTVPGGGHLNSYLLFASEIFDFFDGY